MAMIVDHTFITPKSNDNDMKEEEKYNANKEAIIVCGTTGTGKSSLIKLFCGDNVKVGHKTKSETQESKIFVPKNFNNIYWLDSQGANDSKGEDDEKVLTDILKKLYNENVSNIKVIWCVSGDMCREKNEFQTQAKFIQSLGKNIWKSCLIIKKKGTPQPQDINGVVEAANHYGAQFTNNDKRLFGFTALDVIDQQKDQKLKTLSKYITNQSLRKAAYKDNGYLTNQEIVQEVCNKLSTSPSLHIQFTLKQCEKCGIKGDPRFIYAPCHSQMEKYHPKSTEPYHPGYIRQVHTSSLNWRHTGYQRTETTTSYYHSSSRLYWNFFKHGDSDWRHSCCQKYKGRTGCKTSYSSSTSWSCCGYSSGSSGCVYRYGCCDKSSGSTGCRSEWSCCSAPKHNKGCKRRYLCCKEDLDYEGCEDRCRSCHGKWGESNGCTKTTKQ